MVDPTPRSAADFAALATRLTDEAYASTLPFTKGAGAALALSEEWAVYIAGQSVPSLSEGPYLRLIARGEGLEVFSGEDDAGIRERIKGAADDVTLPTLKAALDRVLSPGSAQVYSHRSLRFFLRLAGEQPLHMSWFLNGRNMLASPRTVWVIVDPALLVDTEVRQSFFAEILRLRIPGILVQVLALAGFMPKAGYSWEPHE